MKARSPEFYTLEGVMRIYREDEAGKAVYIADYPLPSDVCDEIKSSRDGYIRYELPPDLGPLRRTGPDEKPCYGTCTIECIILEPYRLYCNGVLIEMGAMIADPHHVAMFVERAKRHEERRAQASAIIAAWPKRA